MGPKSKKDHSSKDQELEFQKIRLDVFKFGLKHLNKQDKESTKLDQLKRLGADVSNKFSDYYLNLIILIVCLMIFLIFKSKKIVDFVTFVS